MLSITRREEQEIQIIIPENAKPGTVLRVIVGKINIKSARIWIDAPYEYQVTRPDAKKDATGMPHVEV